MGTSKRPVPVILLYKNELIKMMKRIPLVIFSEESFFDKYKLKYKLKFRIGNLGYI